VTSPEHGQASYARRLDWGPAGATALLADARPGDTAVVVDVLSFTTTLSVAVEHGVVVYPYPWADTGAASYAADRDAVLATGRRETPAPGATSASVSLSPLSFDAARGIERVVLPSPNGSAISHRLASGGVTVVGACLRNASAVGRWLHGHGGRVCVVAAGERWPDGSLRPAVEDLWGAGALLAALGDEGASPEALAATAAFEAVRAGLPEALAACASGRELVVGGFARDVAFAAEVDVSDVVPLLGAAGFVDVTSHDL
jgi:2-phosphosulfolactate phosphatase